MRNEIPVIIFYTYGDLEPLLERLKEATATWVLRHCQAYNMYLDWKI